MHYLNSTMGRCKLAVLICLTLVSYSSFAQLNSPLSRYGLGDILPNQNIVSRALGGTAIGYADKQSINLTNPAALSNLLYTTFDFGAEVDAQTLKSNNAAAKYTSRNLNVSYLQFGFPLYSGKLNKRDPINNLSWAGSFGLKPVTRINYKINDNRMLNDIDSLYNIFEGSGGLSQATLSTAVRIKDFSIGATSGYSFGNKDFNTEVGFISDTVPYYRSSTDNLSNFGGLFLDLGVQYEIKIDSVRRLNVGAFSNLKQNLRGNRTLSTRTINNNVNGDTVTVDLISLRSVPGRVVMPATYGVGFTYRDSAVMVGVDYTIYNYNQFRYFGTKDVGVQNGWAASVGFQYSPSVFARRSKSYFNYVDYRLGMRYGKNHVNLGDTKDFGVSIGAGLPLTGSLSQINNREYVTLNTSLEYNTRGSKNTGSIRENIFKISFGVSLSSLWFRKYKYQ